MCPSKQANTYLYGGGRTRKLTYLLAELSIVWVAGTIMLDRYLTKNRARVKENYFLERVCIHSIRYMAPVFLVLWVGIPVSQWMYWKTLKISVGVTRYDRDPRPNWPPGEGLLDKLNN